MRALVVAFALAASTAHADTAEPWKVGVTDDQKKRAKELLDEGNALFVDKNYTEALAKYRAAIETWDHPAIRFNVVRCLIQLERSEEAADELKLALKYGAAPLEDAVYAEALAYEKLLAKQVAEVAISCPPQVVVTLDGKDVTCPIQKRVKPGRHQVVGTRSGFLTKTIDVVAVPGETQKVEVALVPLDRVAAKIEHRWPTWVPWAVFGGGLAVAGIGGLVELQAQANLDQYKSQVQLKCGSMPCDPKTLDKGALDRAHFQDKLAITVVALGAATAITGGVMFYLNRGRTVYTEGKTQLGVVPVQGGGAVTLGGRF